MTLNNEVRSELQTLARAYLADRAALSDLLTFEVEHCDPDLELDDTLRRQLTWLSLFGNEYCFDARPLDDFEQVIYEIVGIEPPTPVLTIEREARVLAKACLDNITTPDMLVKFERRCRLQGISIGPIQEQIAVVAARAQEVEDQQLPRSDLDRELLRLLAEPTTASAHAAAGS
ncbi:MAG: hypothetical protein OXS30_05440 [Chloroflexota bacterium]|nr:hypothetical protein [Chloroflexota bacterium]